LQLLNCFQKLVFNQKKRRPSEDSERAPCPSPCYAIGNVLI